MNRPTHVCIISNAHPVDDVRVYHKIAASFQSNNIKVTWVGPNRILFDKDYINYGVDYKLYPPASSKLDRIRFLTLGYKIAKTVSDVDFYFAPEPDSAIVAIHLAKSTGAQVIFDIHEVYHDVMLANWVPKWLIGILKPLVQKILQSIISRSDLVIGVNQAVLDPYKHNKTTKMIVRSCAPIWFASGPQADVCGEKRSGLVLMHGKSTAGRGTIIVLEALAIAKDKVPDLRVIIFEEFIEHIDGFGIDEFQGKVRCLGLEGVVDFRKKIPTKEMPSLLASCDVGLISYNKKMGIDSLPNRLFEYMATGLVVIAPTYSKEIANIINSEECGVLVDFEDPRSLADAIIYLSQHPEECRRMGNRARKAFVEGLNWDVEVQQLFAWMDDQVSSI
jgi:glycosyltransferase involved in cell wall biosynthesis